MGISAFFMKFGGEIIVGFFALVGTALGWWIHKPKSNLIFACAGPIIWDEREQLFSCSFVNTIVNNGGAPAFVRDVIIDGLSYKDFNPNNRQEDKPKYIHSGNVDLDSNIPAPQGQVIWTITVKYKKEPPKKISLELILEGRWPKGFSTRHTIQTKRITSS